MIGELDGCGMVRLAKVNRPQPLVCILNSVLALASRPDTADPVRGFRGQDQPFLTWRQTPGTYLHHPCGAGLSWPRQRRLLLSVGLPGGQPMPSRAAGRLLSCAKGLVLESRSPMASLWLAAGVAWLASRLVARLLSWARSIAEAAAFKLPDRAMALGAGGMGPGTAIFWTCPCRSGSKLRSGQWNPLCGPVP